MGKDLKKINSKITFVCLLIIFSNSLAESCSPPDIPSSCANVSFGLKPTSTHLEIIVNFENKNINQVVYLSSNICDLKYRFSPLNNSNKNMIDKYIPNANINLNIILCSNNEIIDKKNYKINSDEKISIKCNVSNKLKCQKHT